MLNCRKINVDKMFIHKLVLSNLDRATTRTYESKRQHLRATSTVRVTFHQPNERARARERTNTIEASARIDWKYWKAYEVGVTAEQRYVR